MLNGMFWGACVFGITSCAAYLLLIHRVVLLFLSTIGMGHPSLEPSGLWVELGQCWDWGLGWLSLSMFLGQEFWWITVLDLGLQPQVFNQGDLRDPLCGSCRTKTYKSHITEDKPKTFAKAMFNIPEYPMKLTLESSNITLDLWICCGAVWGQPTLRSVPYVSLSFS